MFKENFSTYCEYETRVELKQVASSELDLPMEQLHGQLSQLNLERLVCRHVQQLMDAGRRLFTFLRSRRAYVHYCDH